MTVGGFNVQQAHNFVIVTASLDSESDLLQDSSEEVVGIDERLDAVLHNLTALQFFNEFCLQEFSIENVLYWIESEILKTVPAKGDRTIFATYLYQTYVKVGAPLCLNLDADLRASLGTEFTEEDQIDRLGDLQEYVYILLRQAAFQRFEESQQFKSLKSFKHDGMTCMRCISNLHSGQIDTHTSKGRPTGISKGKQNSWTA